MIKKLRPGEGFNILSKANQLHGSFGDQILYLKAVIQKLGDDDEEGAAEGRNSLLADVTLRSKCSGYLNKDAGIWKIHIIPFYSLRTSGGKEKSHTSAENPLMLTAAACHTDRGTPGFHCHTQDQLKQALQLATKIDKDPTHPEHFLFTSLPSGRLRTMRASTNRLTHSCLPRTMNSLLDQQ